MLSSTLDIVGDVISYLVWFVNGLLANNQDPLYKLGHHLLGAEPEGKRSSITPYGWTVFATGCPRGETHTGLPRMRSIRPRRFVWRGSSWLTRLWYLHSGTRLARFVSPPCDQAWMWWNSHRSALTRQPGTGHIGAAMRARSRCFELATR